MSILSSVSGESGTSRVKATTYPCVLGVSLIILVAFLCLIVNEAGEGTFLFVLILLYLQLIIGRLFVHDCPTFGLFLLQLLLGFPLLFEFLKVRALLVGESSYET